MPGPRPIQNWVAEVAGKSVGAAPLWQVRMPATYANGPAHMHTPACHLRRTVPTPSASLQS